jgi:clan AA aspartic protease
MGTFMEKITLANAGDISAARNGFITNAHIRTITLEAVPDTGACTLVINEEVRQKLGLAIVDTVEASLADNSSTDYGLTEGVEVFWKNRSATVRALVIPSAGEILLGAQPLESMDLCVDPVNQRLAGVHGDRWVHLVL